MARGLKESLPAFRPLNQTLADLSRALADLPARPQGRLQAEVLATLASLRQTWLQPGPNPALGFSQQPAKLGLDLEPILAKALIQEGLKPEVAKVLSQSLKPRLIALARELALAAATGRDLVLAYPALKQAVERLAERLASLIRPRAEAEAKKASTEAKLAGRSKTTGLSLALSKGEEARAKAEFIRDLQTAFERLFSNQAGATARPSAQRLETLLQETIERHWPLLTARLREAWPAKAEAPLQPAAVILAQNPGVSAEIAKLERALRSLAVRLGLTPQRQAQAALGLVDSALKSLETHQLLNLIALDNQSAFLLPLLAPPESGLRTGQFYFFRPPSQGEAGGERPVRLVFLLEMTRLGQIRVDLSLFKKKLMLNFYAEDEQKARYAGDRLEILVRRLAELGYEVGSVRAHALKAAPPLEDLTPPPDPAFRRGLIDLLA